MRLATSLLFVTFGLVPAVPASGGTPNDELLARVPADASIVDLPPGKGAAVIHRRRFKPNTRPDEWYAILPDDTFAWSNSERLLRAVVEATPGAGFGASPRYQSVRNALPAKSLVKLYIDP